MEIRENLIKNITADNSLRHKSILTFEALWKPCACKFNLIIITQVCEVLGDAMRQKIFFMQTISPPGPRVKWPQGCHRAKKHAVIQRGDLPRKLLGSVVIKTLTRYHCSKKVRVHISSLDILSVCDTCPQGGVWWVFSGYSGPLLSLHPLPLLVLNYRWWSNVGMYSDKLRWRGRRERHR